ncbi:MAG: hypothetical protein IPH98_08385 [Saprospiraceae bacterium]|nr:hypothetical protein [Candidatus Defluviibacterium haderslevense]
METASPACCPYAAVSACTPMSFGLPLNAPPSKFELTALTTPEVYATTDFVHSGGSGHLPSGSFRIIVRRVI